MQKVHYNKGADYGLISTSISIIVTTTIIITLLLLSLSHLSFGSTLTSYVVKIKYAYNNILHPFLLLKMIQKWLEVHSLDNVFTMTTCFV